jgi:hypothetical protein
MIINVMHGAGAGKGNFWAVFPHFPPHFRLAFLILRGAISEVKRAIQCPLT